MEKFREILMSSNANDALLGEQIDKLQPVWEETSITAGTASTSMFDSLDAVKQYYCKSLHRVVIAVNGTLQQKMGASTTIGIADLADHSLIPKGLVTAYYTSGTINYRLTKNAVNETIAIANLGAELPVGTSISLALEYSVI